ncbi:MAG: hypothetical protein A3C15_01980 [Candidatus Magasanikbacteria bacterium RIFCSPHIGHO2_02_FULL_50_9b]|uniref:Vitamin K epoxide reductase domain-containing protein n=1 Tax=Candidatus Magasanikbacteria bacterium RIFCSPHIGHO2_02_FULL_50_9b TaxID=1798682 RepID=A0A1F6M954_9BACT|nr:MAG: hypothetical protein A3C15_01980 [Candidatus Magasanikbacteria bacterium RIFCSPHIGHO2_02_FULL_50_9b]
MEKSAVRRRAYQIIIAIAALGFLVAAYATVLHFQTGPSTLCNLGEGFDCDKVNRGVYSEMWGVPVSVLGMAGYVIIALLARELLASPRRRLKILLAASIAFALGFSAHLAWISSALLATWCIVCIASYTCTAALAAVFAWGEWE